MNKLNVLSAMRLGTGSAQFKSKKIHSVAILPKVQSFDAKMMDSSSVDKKLLRRKSTKELSQNLMNQNSSNKISK